MISLSMNKRGRSFAAIAAWVVAMLGVAWALLSPSPVCAREPRRTGPAGTGFLHRGNPILGDSLMGLEAIRIS